MKTSGDQQVLTAAGLVAAVLLMAVFTVLNFLSVRRLANTNSTATWWKVGVPVLTIVALAIAGFHTSNLTAADGFNPAGAGGVLAAVLLMAVFTVLNFLSGRRARRRLHERHHLRPAGLRAGRPARRRELEPALVGLITSASVLMYAGAPLALGVLRNRLPDADRPYRLPAPRLLSPLARSRSSPGRAT